MPTTIEIFRNESKVVDFAAGAIIFAVGDAASEMYAIIEGEVEIQRENQVLRALGPAEVFGEMALIDQAPRSATAAALTAVKLAVIDETRFFLLVSRTPFFALDLMRIITDRLRRAQDH